MIPRLLFDLTATQPASGSKRHGGGIYGEIVLKRIIQRNLEVEVVFDSSLWLNPDIQQLLDTHGIISHDNAGTTLQAIADRANCDRVYTCGENPQFRSLIHPMKFYTLHGMRELETPLDNYFYRYRNTTRNKIKFLFKQLLHTRYRAKHTARVLNMIESGTRFVVVSNHTANSIKAFFPQYATRHIPVFYSPSTITQLSTTEPHTPAQASDHTPYFLIVSANRWEKNSLRAIMALDRAFDTTLLDGYKAILTGVDSPHHFRYKFKHPERFEFKGYITDAQLNHLYANAYTLIYPSLNEGFGYPPLEAMYHHVPVIASPYTSIPEICGDAAIYFNPLSVDEILARIIMITDPGIHAHYSTLGHNRYQHIVQRQQRDLDNLIDYLYDTPSPHSK